jgi:hypothetical protein
MVEGNYPLQSFFGFVMCFKCSILLMSLTEQVWVTYLGKERELNVNLHQATSCSKREFIWCLHIACIYYFWLNLSKDITVLTVNLIIHVISWYRMIKLWINLISLDDKKRFNHFFFTIYFLKLFACIVSQCWIGTYEIRKYTNTKYWKF